MNFIYELSENEIGNNGHPEGFFAALAGPTDGNDPYFLYLIPVTFNGAGYVLLESDGAAMEPVVTSLRSDNAGAMDPILSGDATFIAGGTVGEIDLSGYLLDLNDAIDTPDLTSIDFTDGVDETEDTGDDMFVLARSADDADADFTAADLVLVTTVDGSTTYHDLISNIFVSGDEVSASIVQDAVGELLTGLSLEDRHAFVLVDDASLGPASAATSTAWKVLAGHDYAAEVTGLRYDDGGTPATSDDTLKLEIATLDTRGLTMADLVVRVNYEQGPSKYALVMEEAFDGSQTLNYSAIESSLLNALTTLGHSDPDLTTMDIDFVLVEDASTMVDSTGAGLDILVEEFGVDTPTVDDSGGDDHTPPEFTGLALNDKGNEDPSDDTFMVVRGENDDEDYSGADLMAWIRPEGADPYLLEIVQDPFSDGDEISVGILNNSINVAFGGEENVPEFVELVLVNDSNAAEPFVLATLIDDGEDETGPTTDALGVDSPFELVEVAGERYGDIITFGIQLKDDGDATTATTYDLASASFQIDWEDGEYEYWGGFENVNATPTNETEAGVSLGLTLNNAGTDDTRINLETFGFGDTAPITYTEGDLVATFMLERTDQSSNVTNDIDLTKSNYSEADDDSTTDVDESLVDIMTKPQTFEFDYDLDTIKIDMVTASGVEAPDATLYVSSDTVTDGLSVVAVEQMGRLVKYQLVLNVSVPMTMDELATIDADQSVDIYGAHIFTDSLIDITSLEDGAGSASVAGAVIAATDADAAAVAVGDAANGYTGSEFFDQVDVAMGLLDDTAGVDASLLEAIDVTDHLHIDVTGLVDLTAADTDGRYVLAEFVAFTKGSISFSDDWNVDDGIKIVQREVDDADDSTQTFTVSDGSDVVLLGESFYLNPGLNIDAISATDALGALKIASDDTGYSQSQIIAADFDADGLVEAMDAYNILHYAVFGEGSEDELPTWVYIDDIDSGAAAADDVTYDDNIDLFIGDLTNIDATGVLRGDVSENYTEVPANYNIIDYYLGEFVDAMGDLGTDLETAPIYEA